MGTTVRSTASSPSRIATKLPSKRLLERGECLLFATPTPTDFLPCSLFNIVVDNDETASKIVDIMTKEKSGRVTMIPLNRLKPKNIVYPNAKEAIPMCVPLPLTS